MTTDTRAAAAPVTTRRSSADGARLMEGLVTPRPHRIRKRPPAVTLAIRVGSVLLVFVAWWIAARHINDVNRLPSPVQVFHNFGYLFLQQDLWANIGISLERALKGLAIGATCGLLLGIAAGVTMIGEELFDAPMQLLRFTPFLALVPLFITWFGLGEKPKIILIALACSTPVYLNTANAVRNVDRKVVEAARSFGLSKFRLLKEVTLPLSLPGILTGLRFAMAISVLALVAAEQINANSGIGAMMLTAQSNLNTVTVFCCVVVYMIFGICFDIIVRTIEHFALRWRAGVAVR
jgi:sulfonate transport system permease protein